MATEVELGLGEHSVVWTLAGYADLNAIIDVTESVVSCVSVTGGSCGSITPPGVVASGFAVTGYLAEAAADIHSWLTGKGGKEDIGSAEFIELKMAYLGIMPLAFTPTSSHVVGTKFYYFYSITGDYSWITMGDGLI